MGVIYFSIYYDHKFYYPGQLIPGRIHLSVDEPVEVRALELTLSGGAKSKWTVAKRQKRTKHCTKEPFFKRILKLAGDGHNFILPAGDYVYPFFVSLPAFLPPSFQGKYGGIRYRGKARLDLVNASDEFVEKHFLVENRIDLNKFSELISQPYKDERSEMMTSWLCASGAPIKATVGIPRLGFVPGEPIPINIVIDNRSKVEVTSIRINLKQITDWKAGSDSKRKKTTMKTRKLDHGVGARASKTLTEYFELEPGSYPRSGICEIIKIRYELEIQLKSKARNPILTLKAPITIGDIPLGGSSSPHESVTDTEFVSPQVVETLTSSSDFEYNPDLVNFNTHPSSAPGPKANLEHLREEVLKYYMWKLILDHTVEQSDEQHKTPYSEPNPSPSGLWQLRETFV